MRKAEWKCEVWEERGRQDGLLSLLLCSFPVCANDEAPALHRKCYGAAFGYIAQTEDIAPESSDTPFFYKKLLKNDLWISGIRYTYFSPEN